MTACAPQFSHGYPPSSIPDSATTDQPEEPWSPSLKLRLNHLHILRYLHHLIFLKETSDFLPSLNTLIDRTITFEPLLKASYRDLENTSQSLGFPLPLWPLTMQFDPSVSKTVFEIQEVLDFFVEQNHRMEVKVTCFPMFLKGESEWDVQKVLDAYWECHKSEIRYSENTAMIEELDGFLHPLLWNCGDMRDSLVGLMEELRRGRDGHLGRHLRYLEGLRGRFRGFWRVKRQEGKRGRGWRRRCREFEGQIRRLEELVRGQLGDGKGMEAEKQAVTIQGLEIAGFGYDSDNSDMELELTDRDRIHSPTESTDNWEQESEPLVREQQSESKPAINDALLIDDIDTESHYSNDELELTDHESLYSDTEPWEPEPLICPPSPLRLQKGPSSSSPRTAGGPLRIHLTRHTNSDAPKIPRSGDGETREVTPTADIDILLNDIVLDAAETAEGIDDERIHTQDKIHHLNPVLSPTPIPKTNFPASISIPAATSDSGESSVRRRRNVNALPSPMHQSTKGLPLAPKVRRIDIGVLGANTITWADNTSPDAKATSPAAPTVGKVISIRTRRERRRGGGREWVAGVEQDAEGMGDDGGLGEATGTVEDGDNAQVANRITQTDTTDLEAHEKGEESDTARLTLLPMSSGINSSNHRDAETRIDQVDVSIPAESQKLNPDMDRDMDMINFAANTGVCMEFMEIECMEPEPLDPDAMEPEHSNNKKIGRLTMLMTELLDSDGFTARDGVWIDNLNPDIDAERADEEDDELVTAPSSPVLPINITARGSKGTTLPDRLTSKESGTGEADALIHPTPENADETNVSRPTSVNLRTYNRDSMLDLSALSVPRNKESMNIGFQGERVTWPGYGNPAVKGNAQDSIRGRRMSCQTNIGSQHCPAHIAILLKNIDTPMETEDISTDISDVDTARTSQRSVTIPHSSSSTTSKMEPAVDVDVLSTSSEKRSSCVDLDIGKLSPEGLTEGLGISVPVPPSKKQKTVLANIDVVAANRNICVRKGCRGPLGLGIDVLDVLDVLVYPPPSSKRRKTVPTQIDVGRANENTRAGKMDITVEKPLGLGIVVPKTPKTNLQASNDVERVNSHTRDIAKVDTSAPPLKRSKTIPTNIDIHAAKKPHWARRLTIRTITDATIKKKLLAPLVATTSLTPLDTDSSVAGAFIVTHGGLGSLRMQHIDTIPSRPRPPSTTIPPPNIAAARAKKHISGIRKQDIGYPMRPLVLGLETEGIEHPPPSRAPMPPRSDIDIPAAAVTIDILTAPQVVVPSNSCPNKKENIDILISPTTLRLLQASNEAVLKSRSACREGRRKVRKGNEEFVLSPGTIRMLKAVQESAFAGSGVGVLNSGVDVDVDVGDDEGSNFDDIGVPYEAQSSDQATPPPPQTPLIIPSFSMDDLVYVRQSRGGRRDFGSDGESDVIGSGFVTPTGIPEVKINTERGQGGCSRSGAIEPEQETMPVMTEMDAFPKSAAAVIEGEIEISISSNNSSHSSHSEKDQDEDMFKLWSLASSIL